MLKSFEETQKIINENLHTNQPKKPFVFPERHGECHDKKEIRIGRGEKHPNQKFQNINDSLKRRGKIVELIAPRLSHIQKNRKANSETNGISKHRSKI